MILPTRPKPPIAPDREEEIKRWMMAPTTRVHLNCKLVARDLLVELDRVRAELKDLRDAVMETR